LSDIGPPRSTADRDSAGVDRVAAAMRRCGGRALQDDRPGRTAIDCARARNGAADRASCHRPPHQEMNMLRALAVVIMAAPAMPALAADPHPVVTYSNTAKFENVRDDLRIAIESKGLVIDYQSFVNNMLERTGRDIGSAKKPYIDAQAFVFCSASLSRRTMEADPANVSMCPYSIVVYATAQEPDKVSVSYRRPWRPDGSAASKASLKEVESLLDAVAREALGLR
jgi:uncharacterized protein (DUF302 family)